MDKEMKTRCKINLSRDKSSMKTQQENRETGTERGLGYEKTRIMKNR